MRKVFMIVMLLSLTLNSIEAKKHIYVLTDISSIHTKEGEPDDAESLCRLLLYTDQLQIEGIGATYTNHKGGGVHPDLIDSVLAAYAEVYPNLLRHGNFQKPEDIAKRVFAGNPKKGIEQIGQGHDTALSNDLVRTIYAHAEKQETLWILVWGAPLDLAQALWKITQTLEPNDANVLLDHIRVYAILDQYDGSGPWIRKQFPNLFYILNNASFRGMYIGGDKSLASAEWVARHVKSRTNALARMYPVYDYLGIQGLKEGDTPSFLYLLDGDPEHPEGESWGGTFHRIAGTNHYVDGEKADLERLAVNVNKWRPAFQKSFAERLAWAEPSLTGYLFAYFSGNKTDGQQLRFALSRNGVDYEPLNGGKPVMEADTFAVMKAIRDPHILRCSDGWFRMVMTDFDMSRGKWTNRGIILSRSRDLVHWENHAVHFPDRYAGKDFARANAVWAPQTIYDPSVGKYMIYFSLHSEKDGPFPKDAVYFAYANDDFTDLATDPQPLFRYPNPTIDTDIVQDETGVYHLFFNTWGGEEGLIRKQYTFTDLHHPEAWTLLSGRMQPNAINSEGSCAFPLIEGGWILMYDCYKDGFYQFCRSDDLQHFELLKSTPDTGVFTPRHGTAIPITEAEYQRLKRHFK